MEIRLDGVGKKSAVVSGNTVHIVKCGIFGTHEKSIPISNISSVEVRKPGAMFNGYIQFCLPGGKHHDLSFTLSGGTYDAVSDENSVVFSGKENYDIALKIKEYIENYAAPAASSISSISNADEILKYKQLLDMGAITQEQYDKKLRELL